MDSIWWATLNKINNFSLLFYNILDFLKNILNYFFYFFYLYLFNLLKKTNNKTLNNINKKNNIKLNFFYKVYK